jgi:hypothetical protein
VQLEFAPLPLLAIRLANQAQPVVNDHHIVLPLSDVCTRSSVPSASPARGADNVNDFHSLLLNAKFIIYNQLTAEAMSGRKNNLSAETTAASNASDANTPGVVTRLLGLQLGDAKMAEGIPARFGPPHPPPRRNGLFRQNALGIYI